MMGQDSWNLQYGNMHPAKYRRGTQVAARPDEGYGGAKMVPGYAGPYKNWKGKVLKEKSVKPDGNPRKFGPDKPQSSGYKSAREEFMTPQKELKRRK